MSKGFSLSQILLHWSVALLVLAQYLNDAEIGTAWRALRRGEPLPDGSLATVHVVVGVAVLALVAWRIVLRVRLGVPPPPADEPLILRAVAAATHFLLYAAVLILPVSGLVAWYGGIASAIEVHRAVQNLLLPLVGLHVAGALYQRFVLGLPVLRRMTVPGAVQER